MSLLPSRALSPAITLLEQASEVLRAADVEHCLAGSLGAWIHGGPEPSKDVDLVIQPEDTLRAADALGRAGLLIQLPPRFGSRDPWFFRAWSTSDNPMPVEVIFAPSLPSQVVLAKATMPVGCRILVASATHVLALKLAGLREEHPAGGPDRIDLVPLLAIARGMGTKVDRHELCELVEDSPYARAFLDLLEAVPTGPVESPALLRQARMVDGLQVTLEALARLWPSDRAYELLGHEYYDATLHPTCAEFRVGSKALLRPHLLAEPQGSIVEVGAGCSVAAELLQEESRPLEGLLITDANPSMLEHSRQWIGQGAQVFVAPASELPVSDGSVDLLIASLGDPYNTPEFWAEARRVISPGGRILFTAPAASWACRLRHARMEAEMTLGESSVNVPSFALSIEEQEDLVAAAGLLICSHTIFERGRLPDRVSGALQMLAREEPVIVCFECKAT